MGLGWVLPQRCNGGKEWGWKEERWRGVEERDVVEKRRG
jgi:hypothetical protein